MDDPPQPRDLRPAQRHPLDLVQRGEDPIFQSVVLADRREGVEDFEQATKVGRVSQDIQRECLQEPVLGRGTNVRVQRGRKPSDEIAAVLLLVEEGQRASAPARDATSSGLKFVSAGCSARRAPNSGSCFRVPSQPIISSTGHWSVSPAFRF